MSDDRDRGGYQEQKERKRRRLTPLARNIAVGYPFSDNIENMNPNSEIVDTCATRQSFLRSRSSLIASIVLYRPAIVGDSSGTRENE